MALEALKGEKSIAQISSDHEVHSNMITKWKKQLKENISEIFVRKNEREHRLYQTDGLIRKYNFSLDEIPFDKDGNLSLSEDPKETWTKRHPEYFPVNINKADRFKLIRIQRL